MHYTMKHDDVTMTDLTQDNIFKQGHQKENKCFESQAIESEKMSLN